jgi:hypothetical protein
MMSLGAFKDNPQAYGLLQIQFCIKHKFFLLVEKCPFPIDTSALPKMDISDMEIDPEELARIATKGLDEYLDGYQPNPLAFFTSDTPRDMNAKMEHVRFMLILNGHLPPHMLINHEHLGNGRMIIDFHPMGAWINILYQRRN